MANKHAALSKIRNLACDHKEYFTLDSDRINLYSLILGKNIHIYIGNKKVEILVEHEGTLIYNVENFCNAKIEIKNNMLVINDTIGLLIK